MNKKVKGILFIAAAFIALFVNFLIYNADNLANLTITPLGWIVYAIIAIVFGIGIYNVFKK